MDRRHLRCQYGIRSFAVCREVRPLDRLHLMIGHALTTGQRRHERAQADAGCAEVRHLIELYHRVDAVMRLEDIAHLSRRDGIEAAAERAELDQGQIRMLGHELRRMIEARMIAPLIDDMDLLGLHRHMIDGILRYDRQLVGLYHIRYTMIDLRIDMVGAPHEQYGLLARALDALHDAGAVVTHILAIVGQLLIGLVDGSLDLRFAEPLALSQLLIEALCHAFLIVDGQERLNEVDILFAQDIHIAANVLRIGGYDRTIVMIGRRMLLILHIVGLAGIEYLRQPFFNQVHDMAMRELRRIAQRIRRHRSHALVVHLCTRLARQHDLIAQLRKEREPERIVLVHVQRARYADAAAFRVLQRFIAEYPLVLVLIDVRDITVVLHAADAALAAIAREILATVREFLHRYEAFIATTFATIGARRDCELLQILSRQHGRVSRLRCCCLLRQDSRTIGPHEAGDIRPYDIAPQQLLHAAQHGIVVERAALHDDMVAERAHVLELHDLEQGILYDRERNASRYISDTGAFLLGLLHFRVHEDRATRAEIDRRLRLKRLGRELARRHMQSLSEVLDKGATAGGAGFIQRDIANTSVLDEEAFHVLTADIEYERHLRAEFLRRPQMRKRLDLAAIRMDGRLHDGLAIAGRHRAGDICLGR